jgi:hypothetical protein
MLLSADVYKMITYIEFIESCLLGVPIIGLLYLRWKKPELDRPLKVKYRFQNVHFQNEEPIGVGRGGRGVRTTPLWKKNFEIECEIPLTRIFFKN